MKNILIQLGRTILMLVACIIQFVSLVFRGIEWMFGKAGDLLGNASCSVAIKARGEKEKDSEVTV